MTKKAHSSFKRRRRVFFREWRKHRRLTQEQLAGMVGRSTSWVSMVETGEVGYTEEALDLLSEALGCSPADLLERDPRHDEPIRAEWESLDPAQRRQAVAVMRALKSTQ